MHFNLSDYNIVYLYFLLPALIFSLIASARVKSTFNKYSKDRTASGITGAQAAERVLSANGLSNIRVEQVSGKLTDHYDPKNNVIRLSSAVYGSSSTAAVGVACHEAGHALQYASDYAPIKFRASIIPITNFGSKLAVPLIILGILLTAWSNVFINVAYAGVVCFGLCVVFQLVTLPVEFNASRRAMETISHYGLLTAQEQSGARKVLSAAALTYVAALAVSIAQLLRFLVMINGRSRR